MLANNYPGLSAILSDLWCMERGRLNQLVADLVRSSDQLLGSGALGVYASPNAKLISEGVATIPIHGVIMKRVPAIFSFMGIEATSTEKTSEAIKAALADPEVESIQLDIDSPGGTISGVKALADLIDAGKALKPINANVSDLAASAAYWIGSQADTLTADPGSLVGSIGVYRVLVDSSKAAEESGVKVHLISSGENKGTGTAGAPVTDEQLADEQRIVDQAAGMFNAAIARGRQMDLANVEKLATGSTWFADEAKQLGLVDEITAVELPQKAEVDPSISNKEESVENLEAQNELDGLKIDSQADEMRLQLEELQSQLEATKAEAAAKDAALVAVIETQKSEVINEGVAAGKIVPSMLDQVTDYAQFCGADVEKLKGFVAALPVQTHAKPVSEEPGVVVRETLTESDRAVVKLLGISPESFQQKSSWAAISAQGEALDRNGQKIGGSN